MSFVRMFFSNFKMLFALLIMSLCWFSTASAAEFSWMIRVTGKNLSESKLISLSERTELVSIKDLSQTLPLCYLSPIISEGVGYKASESRLMKCGTIGIALKCFIIEKQFDSITTKNKVYGYSQLMIFSGESKKTDDPVGSIELMCQ